MKSEDKTVDLTNMVMGNDHDTIFVNFKEYAGQEDTNFENSVSYQIFPVIRSQNTDMKLVH